MVEKFSQLQLRWKYANFKSRLTMGACLEYSQAVEQIKMRGYIRILMPASQLVGMVWSWLTLAALLTSIRFNHKK